MVFIISKQGKLYQVNDAKIENTYELDFEPTCITRYNNSETLALGTTDG